MTIQKIKSGRVKNIIADAFVGERGMIFYNESLGDLRLSDGVTPGGIPLNVGGSGGTVDWASIAGKPTFANVAYTGSYNDLINLPSGDTIEGGSASTIYNNLASELFIDGGTA